jgi:hypothetical protein
VPQKTGYFVRHSAVLAAFAFVASTAFPASGIEEVPFDFPLEGTPSDLPTIDDPAWTLLASVEVIEEETPTSWAAIKTFPEPLRAATDGFEITGFIVPIVPDDQVRSFILVQTPSDCPFCSGGYGPVLEVNMKRGMRALPEFSQIRVRGTLELIEDEETFQMYRLNDAIKIWEQP